MTGKVFRIHVEPVLAPTLWLGDMDTSGNSQNLSEASSGISRNLLETGA
jgi:hypothetical protein